MRRYRRYRRSRRKKPYKITTGLYLFNKDFYGLPKRRLYRRKAFGKLIYDEVDGNNYAYVKFK